MLKVISIYQIFGGISGLFFVYFFAPMYVLGSGSESVLFYAELVCVTSVVAGAALWWQTKTGLVCSILVQVLQTPAFVIAPVAYVFGLGAALVLGVEAVRSGQGILSYHFLSDYKVIEPFIFVQYVPRLIGGKIGVNVVALVCLCCLLWRFVQSVRTPKAA